MEKHYYRLEVIDLPRELEEAATEICFRYECAGVSEALSFKQENLRYLPEVEDSSHVHLEAFFVSAPSQDCLDELRALAEDIQIQFTKEENKDWLEEWKKGFEAFRLVEDIWVVPSWQRAPGEAKTVLWIDPGMAFGTGTHETTQLASELIAASIQAKSHAPSVLDVGTGTGILALVAHHYGAKPVVGLEIDPVAREVARENVERNQVDHVAIFDHQIEDEKETYDLVIANIIDGILLDLKEPLYGAVKPGGDLVLSGILSERLQAFLQEFMCFSDLTLHKQLQRGEWEALWLKKGL